MNLQKEEGLQERIVACLYVDLKAMKELEELMASGHRDAELKYGKAIMSAPCACIIQMYGSSENVCRKRYNKETQTLEAISIYQNEADIPSPYLLLGNISGDIKL